MNHGELSEVVAYMVQRIADVTKHYESAGKDFSTALERAINGNGLEDLRDINPGMYMAVSNTIKTAAKMIHSTMEKRRLKYGDWVLESLWMADEPTKEYNRFVSISLKPVCDELRRMEKKKR